MNNNDWPELPLDAWKDTLYNLHRWTQIPGKVRLAFCPMENHWWNIPLYLTARGLTTSPIPYQNRTFEIQFDFLDHTLEITTSGGAARSLPLVPCTVADFYRKFMAELDALDIHVPMYATPVEVPDPIPFEQDMLYNAYDAEYVSRWWHILAKSDMIFKEFRGLFLGKSSPVQFFWGSFDHAVSRYSGRPAPPREWSILPKVMSEAYSHEVSSAGFWPGSGDIKGAAYYCYHTPEPAGFAEAKVKPEAAYYDKTLSEFVLMYDDMRQTPDPAQTLLDFLQSSYEAGATLARWDRRAFER